MSTQAKSDTAAPNTGRPGDAIRLTVPARPEFVAVVQTATSALALGCGLTAADVEGLCDALDTAMAVLIEGTPIDTLEIGFELATNRLTVVVAAPVMAGTSLRALTTPQSHALTTQLQLLVEQVHVNEAGTALQFTKTAGEEASPPI